MLGEHPRALRLMWSAGGVLGPLADRPAALASSGNVSFLSRRLGAPAGKAAGLAALAAQLQPYDFAGIKLTPPTRTFNGTLELDVGGRRVLPIDVGPAHTPGDLIVSVPDARTVFAECCSSGSWRSCGSAGPSGGSPD